MHETIIAGKIIGEAKKHGLVKAITVEVGELAHITADELRKILDSLVDWELEITSVPAEVRCKCGYSGPPHIIERGHDLVVFVCPKCSAVPEVVRGKDIILKKVKVE